MEGEEAEKRKSKPLTFAGLTALAAALDSKQAHTSFGKLPLSKETTAPNFGRFEIGLTLVRIFIVEERRWRESPYE